MYSQCPECLTRFRVTAVALRAARGTVRCGRCGSAFDALQSLTDTVPEEPETRPDAPLATPVAAAEPAGPAGEDVPEFHFSADDIEQVFVDARDWTERYPETGSVEEPRAASERAPLPPAGAQVYVHEPEAVEDITLEGERIVIEGLPELDDDLREIVDASRTEDQEPGADDAVRLPEVGPRPVDPDATGRFPVLQGVPETESPEPGTPAPIAAPLRTDEGVAVEPAPGLANEAPPPVVPFRLRQRASLDDTLVVEDDAPEPRRRRAAMWALGAALLGLVLLGQVVHHYRHDLARDGRAGPVVREAYARLGQPLPPHWDLAAYELRQWGAGPSAVGRGGTLTVRASVRNGAPFAQPLPLLRLELEDRFGNTVARRDFEPGEYLKDPAQAGRLLDAGASAEAALEVVDTGRDAVGYRLDLCVRGAGAVLHCAQSPAQASQARR